MPAHSSAAGAEPTDSVDSFLQRVAADTDEVCGSPAYLRSGTMLGGRFMVERFARRGGMGTIYQGRDQLSGAAVAIKTVGRIGSESRPRFLREIKILAELDHPGVVRYLDHGISPDGLDYLVMEWLTGEDLAERLQRTQLSLAEVLALMRRCCTVLAFAHSRGIVHRDIKPANLFLPDSDPRGVKLLDFGVARFAEADPALTTMGARIGTVGYMSPEQAMGDRELDARADVFALGCVFYECLTGRAPFASPHAVGILAKVLQEEPARPSDLRSDLDPRFDRLIAKMLAKKRDERPRDGGALVVALEQLTAWAGHPDAKGRRALSPRHADQRVVSVILGRPAASACPASETIEASLGRLEAKFGARVAPLKGGAVLLVLSSKGEANDRASQAALCALELSKLHPELRLAVATGLVDTSGSVPVGIAIDRAALLLGEMDGPSGVLLDDVTLGLVGLRFEVQRVEGKSQLLAARHDFDAPRQLMGRPTPYVGREREIHTLDEALNECIVEDVSRVVLITGPPGIGKSRLASEWLARGGRGGVVRTLFARLDPTAAGSAWSMVQQLIRDAAGLREADQRGAQLAKLRQHLVALLGEALNPHIFDFLAELVGLVAEDVPNPLLLAARSNPDIMREQVRRALHGWFEAEASGQPLVLVLEDLHWCDGPSLSFLVESLRESPNRALMVLALARPEVERQFPEFCERAIMQVRLPGLGAKAAQRLIEAAFEQNLETETQARLIRVADGNPFYLEELIRYVASGRQDLPETVVAMAQSRIERLDSEARCVLRAASAFGERCWDLGIAEALDSNVDLESLLQVLKDEEILLPVPDSRYPGALEYRFRHALLRDAAYGMMTAEERCSAHGAAGEWLEKNGEADERLLADHYEAADARERAMPWLLRAAKRAVNAGDLASTIGLADRAAALATTDLNRGRCILLRGYVEALRGNFYLEPAREALDFLPIGTPLWWLGVVILIFGAVRAGKPAEAAPYVALAREAPVERDDEVPLGQGLMTLVGGLVLLGKASLAETILERARVSERDSADPVFKAFLDAAQCALDAMVPKDGRWRLERALLQGRRCAAELGELGAIHGQSIALTYLSVASMHLGLHEEARDASRLACVLQNKASSEIRDPWPYVFLSKAHLRLGDAEAALTALEPIRSHPDHSVLQMLPILLGEAALQRGDAATARAEVAAACNGPSPRLQRLAACVMARAQLNQGQTNDALRTIELALEASTSDGLESGIDLMNLRAECLLSCGQTDAARRVAARTRGAVLEFAAGIEDLTLRQSFLENVQPCARALKLYEQTS